MSGRHGRNASPKRLSSGHMPALSAEYVAEYEPRGVEWSEACDTLHAVACQLRAATARLGREEVRRRLYGHKALREYDEATVEGLREQSRAGGRRTQAQYKARKQQQQQDTTDYEEG